MDNSQIVTSLIKIKDDLENKKGKNYFFVADTGGKPMASVEYQYRLAKTMQDMGYAVFMLHEKDKFIGVKDWLGAEYSKIPHISLTKMNGNAEHNITPLDTFFIPELYIDLVKKLAENKLPSDTVIIAQSHTFIFKFLNVGEQWRQYKVENVITTSAKMKLFIEEYQPVNNVFVVNPPITEEFSPSTKPQKPIISIYGRDTEELERIIKLFYAKYPMFSWISFRNLGNMRKEDFANNIKETMLSVWVDDFATFGTFPLESMACGVPVIAKIPDLIPEWAEKTDEQGNVKLNSNAIFISNNLSIPDYICKFVESWLLDDVNPAIYESLSESPERYSLNNFTEQAKSTINGIIDSKIQKVKLTLEKYKNHE